MQKDLQQTSADLQTEEKDLNTTYQDEQATVVLAAQHPNGENGQAGSDAGQVGADQGQVGSDQGQLSADMASVQNNISQLQSDYPDSPISRTKITELSNRQEDYREPTRQSAIAQASSAMSSGDQQMKHDLAQAMVN